MSKELSRAFEVDAPVDDLWEFLSDATRRAEAISAVEGYDRVDDAVVWHVEIPVPGVESTVDVTTRDEERDPPHYVRFRGTSSIMDVTGEHRLEPTDRGCRVTNRFTVEGSLPGVETYFAARLDDELDNLRDAIEHYLDARVEQAP